jgi:hypothetical protein
LYQVIVTWRETLHQARAMPELRVVRLDLQIGEQQRFAAWLVASPVGFYGYEDSVDLFKRTSILKLENPTLAALSS